MSRQTERRELDLPTHPAARRGLSIVLSVVAHLLIVLALLSAPTRPPKAPEVKSVTVALVDEPTPAPVASPPAAAPPAPTHSAPAHAAQTHPARAHTARAHPAPVHPAPVALARASPTKPVARREVAKTALARADTTPSTADEEEPTGQADAEMSDAQLAGAAMAGEGSSGGSANGSGSGSGGGLCDMASRLQTVLRKDRLVQTAVGRFAGKAVRVWDGDWVWMRGDVGRGLSAVRQAMEWEIAYAPEACRSKPMHGLVVFSVNGSQGPVRLAVGLDRWRWTDLLTPHPEVSETTSSQR